MKLLYSILVIIFTLPLFAQKPQVELPELSEQDKAYFASLPEFKLSDEMTRRSIPSSVDNSQTIHFPPLVAQVSLECGQASSVGVMFTHEINVKRDANGQLEENRYPTHFVYNFINGGSSTGVCFWETFEILRNNGTPDVAHYGGMAQGGDSRWISGYDNYYNAMQNRVNGVYNIRTNTVEGINTLRQWIYDHGCGDAVGGCGVFYSCYDNPGSTLPTGTPEAGSAVITSWGSSPNHAMTIVGYNDNICWDYNQDGQYTNDIDINGDGQIDPRDWEIGGFKMANTYGSISYWGDNGFSYMMYKSVADATSSGGIWDNRVAIVDANGAYSPKVTAKVKMSYGCREKIKIMLGVSPDPTATEPTYILNYPIIDFQGGCYGMTGSSQEIEVGFDLNPLLQYIEPNQTARYFLTIYEKDDYLSSYDGTIHEFSIIDYTNMATEHTCQQAEIPLVNNGATTLSIDVASSHTLPIVNNGNLPELSLYVPYQVQLTANSGTPPYRWNFVYDYEKTSGLAEPCTLEETKLTVAGNNDGTVLVELPFEFDFYGEKYSSVYASADGFLRFEQGLSTWPFYIEGRSYFKGNKIISPCFADVFYIKPSDGDGIWYSYCDDYVNFRWQLSTYGQDDPSTIKQEARLFKDGRIEFHYGEHLAAAWVSKFGGISSGNGVDFIDLHPVGSFTPLSGGKTSLSPINYPKGFSITEDGLLTAFIEDYQENISATVRVIDNNNLSSQTPLIMDVTGIRMDYDILSGNDSQIDFGESFSLGLEIENFLANNLSEGTLTIMGDDIYFEILDGTATCPEIASNSTMQLNELFDIHTDVNVPNGHQATFRLNLTTPEGSWTRNILLTAFNADVESAEIFINDGENGNGILDAGDHALLWVTFKNSGGSRLESVIANMSCDEPELSIIQSQASVGYFDGNSTWDACFEIELSENAAPLMVLHLNLELTSANGYLFNETIPFITSLIVENFETNSFSLYDWQFPDIPWIITTGEVYEGIYAARSGIISDSESSTISLDYEVTSDSEISFYHKVSSEGNYDYLIFSIDGQRKMAISGESEWEEASYRVTTGSHNFSWCYGKDYSVSNGSDCGWIDYILLPERKINTSITENQSVEINLSVFPNPAKDMVKLNIQTVDNETFKLYICDQMGRIVFDCPQNVGTSSFEINTSTFKPGVYNICVFTENQIIVKKLICL